MNKNNLLLPKRPPASSLETPKEIADLIRATPQTVRNWHRDGIIPARFAVGRIMRFDRAEVMAALANHEKKGRAS